MEKHLKAHLKRGGIGEETIKTLETQQVSPKELF